MHRMDAADQRRRRLRHGRDGDRACGRRSGPRPRPGFSNSTSRVFPIAALLAASCCDRSSFCSTSSRALLTLSAICFLRRRGGRAGTRAVFEGKALRIFDIAHQLQGRFEIRVALAGKADNEIGGEGDVGTRWRECARSRRDNRRRCAGGSSPPARCPNRTAPADAGRASAFRLSPCAAIRSSPMSRGWLVV